MQAIHEKIPVAGKASVRPSPCYGPRTARSSATDTAAGIAFSMRFASWDRETGTLIGFSQLGGDANLAQFTHSMSLVTTLHNFLYADTTGQHRLLRRRPGPDRAARSPRSTRGCPRWATAPSSGSGYVPFADMPHSVNPAQGYLDNWNTKPSAAGLLPAERGRRVLGHDLPLVADQPGSGGRAPSIEHRATSRASSTTSAPSTTRTTPGPAAPYFIPFLVQRLPGARRRSTTRIVNPATHPDLAAAIGALKRWNGDTTLGSPAMSIFMNFLEAFERNVFEGGTFTGEQYTGAVNFSDSEPGAGHATAGSAAWAPTTSSTTCWRTPAGIVPCGTLCYHGDYFAGHRDQLLVESVNDAITILSGTGTQLGQDVPGFGTTDIAKWGYRPGPGPELGQPRPAGRRRHHALRHERQPEPQHVHDGHRRGTTCDRAERAAAGPERLHLRERAAEPAPVRPGEAVQHLQLQGHAASELRRARKCRT